MMAKFWTAHEIDGHKGIKSPHARELDSMGQEKVDNFLEIEPERLKAFVKNKLRGKIEEIGFGENYTITLEMFPEVNIHILYFNFEEEEEEDDAFNDLELRFLFSGERVSWIPTEDLIGYIEAFFYNLENNFGESKNIHKFPKQKTDLLKMAINQRLDPFKHLKKDHLLKMAEFIGAVIKKRNDEWVLTKSYYQGFNIDVIYEPDKQKLDLDYEGRNILDINNYSRDQLGIYLLNHCLRFLSIQYPNIQFPKIVKQTFSYSYIKKHF
jgi:hypothetical protein